MTLAEYRAERAAEKRAAILTAAETAFLSEGYGGASIEAIAQRAGVSTATVYNHFGSKAALFAAVVEGSVQAIDLEGPADLAATAQAYAALMVDPKVRGVMRLVIAESPRFPEVGAALFEAGKARVYAAFRRAFEAEAARGAIAPIAEPDHAAGQITGMISQSVLMPWLLAGREPGRPTEVIAAAAVARFLQGAQ